MRKVQEKIDEERMSRARKTSEPLYTKQRVITSKNTSLYANIPPEACRIINLGGEGDGIRVQVYEDHIEVWPGDDENER